jgi:hypothetical protein
MEGFGTCAFFSLLLYLSIFAIIFARLISCGLDFSAHACTLIENYVDKEWAANYRNEKF